MINILIVIALISPILANGNITYITLNSNMTYEFQKGDQCELTCPVNQVENSSFIISWFKNKNKISSILTTGRIKIDLNKLSISNFLKLDSGLYHCELITGTGLIIKSSAVKLEFQGMLQRVDNQKSEQSNEIKGEAPEFMNYQENKTLYHYVNSKIELDCLATGSPQPNVLWYKNNQVVSEEEYGIVRNLMLFKFKNLLPSDSGDYKCQVFNQYGEISRSFKILIVQTEKIIVKFNETIPIKCSASDKNDWFVKFKNSDFYSDVKIQIANDDFHLLNIKSESNLIQLPDGSLVIKQANVLNNGLFACRSAGQVDIKVYEIDVIDYRPESVLIQSPIAHNYEISTPTPVIIIAVLSIVSIILILTLSMYYVCNLKNSKNEIQNDNFHKQMQVNHISANVNNPSTIPIDYFKSRRFSHIPEVSTSTPSQVYPSQMFRSQTIRPNYTIGNMSHQQFSHPVYQQDLFMTVQQNQPIYYQPSSIQHQSHTRMNSSSATRSNSYRSVTRY
ncbi:unnamed protein product [Brachionus calyciflorus]|uniref:Ig-like domain-containing protein n=1 Tax=Brachionus calyciflorus TaxID=104777 RepID=A0A813MP77_9BILA|nr:unnamed protein product [Brachionus calyciflorus]